MLPCGVHDVDFFWFNVHNSQDVASWIMKYALFIILAPGILVGLFVCAIREHRFRTEVRQMTIPSGRMIVQFDRKDGTGATAREIFADDTSDQERLHAARKIALP